MTKQDKKAQEATQETVVTTNETVTETPTTEAPETKAPKAPKGVERSLYPEGTSHQVEAGRDKLFFPSGDVFIVPEGQTVQTDENGRIYLV
jgi:myosin-crossreactive antigen